MPTMQFEFSNLAQQKNHKIGNKIATQYASELVNGNYYKFTYAAR